MYNIAPGEVHFEKPNAPRVEPEGWRPLLLFLIFYYFYYAKKFSKIPLFIEKYDYEIDSKSI